MNKFILYLLFPLLLVGGFYFVVKARASDNPAKVLPIAKETPYAPIIKGTEVSTTSATITPELKEATSTEISTEDKSTSATPKTTSSYTVKAGDTVSTIARQFNITTETILLENNLSATSLLKLGQKLIILPVSGTTYKVRSGDTLQSIANKNGAGSEAIASANNLTLTTSLKIGQTLLIPGSTKKAQVAAASIAPSKKIVTKLPVKSSKKKTTVKPVSGSIVWTSTALAELRRIPAGIRPSVRTKINNYARSHGVKTVTKQYYLGLRI
jgi:LysM repeat protein